MVKEIVAPTGVEVYHHAAAAAAAAAADILEDNRAVDRETHSLDVTSEPSNSYKKKKKPGALWRQGGFDADLPPTTPDLKPSATMSRQDKSAALPWKTATASNEDGRIASEETSLFPLRFRLSGRDRRAHSADRPPSPSSSSSSSSGSVSTGHCNTTPRATKRSTKVEKLRELTERLRPPSLPVAPPRSPRHKKDGNNKSNKGLGSVKLKKDGAVSSVTPHEGASERVSAPSPLLRTQSLSPPPKTSIPPPSSPAVPPRKVASVPQPGTAPSTSTATPEKTGDTSKLPFHKQSLFAALDDHGGSTSNNSNHAVSVDPHPSSGDSSNMHNLDDDFFDDTPSKLNSKILVGTYHQRTIPFRSASFSQIDVQVDGSYSRRPRTASISLKPVTFSINKDTSLGGAATLPRKKFGEPTLLALAEESPSPKPTSLPLSFTSPEPDVLVQVTEPTPCEEQPAVFGEGQPDPLTPLHTSTANIQLCCSTKVPPQVEVEPVREVEGEDVPTFKGEEARTGLSDPLLGLVEQSVDGNSKRSSSHSDSGSVSVTADVVLASKTDSELAPPYEESMDATVSEETSKQTLADEEPDSLSCMKSKPLPVLDLLELSNELLRLQAASRDEYRSSLEEESDALLINSDKGLSMVASAEEEEEEEEEDGADEEGSHFRHETLKTDPDWLLEMMQQKCDDDEPLNPSSSSSSSDEGCVPDSLILDDPTPVLKKSTRRKSASVSLLDGMNYGRSAVTSLHDETLRNDTEPNNASAMTVVATTSQSEGEGVGESIRPLSSTFSSSSLADSHLATSDSLSSSDTFVDALDHVVPGLSNEQASNCTGIGTKRDPLQPEALPPDNAPQILDSQYDDQPLSTNSPNRKNSGGKGMSRHHLDTLSTSQQPTRSASPVPLELNTVSCSQLDKWSQRSPGTVRRYGAKRRPLRGPYGEMLEAEMSKSEMSKLYMKRPIPSISTNMNSQYTNDDLSFLRDIREAKSSSPLSPSSPCTTSPPPLLLPGSSNRLFGSSSHLSSQSSPPTPVHSNASPAVTLASSLPLNRPANSAGLPQRKSSASNLPYVLSESELDTVASALRGSSHSHSQKRLQLQASSTPAKEPSLSHYNGDFGLTVSHQRAASSPCQLTYATTEPVPSAPAKPNDLDPEADTVLSNSAQPVPAPVPVPVPLNSPSSSSTAPTSTTTVSSKNSATGQRSLEITLGDNNGGLARAASVKRHRDTRTHVVGELYDTERSYVESLHILVTKYLHPLKSSDNAGLVDAGLVDEMFYQIPAILAHHEVFLEELRRRLEHWDAHQCVGNVFLDAFTKPPVIETYTAFINHWKYAKEAVKMACQAKPAFAKFLGAMAREHKGKLALDSLLIMPVQRIPRYELLIKMLLKHTPRDHPDHPLLLRAQKEVHDLAVKINCVEREALGAEQQQNTLRELESIVEGLGPGHLTSVERTFLRHDLVTMPSALGTRKERAFFLFSDLLVITSVKRRSGTTRKASSSSPGSFASTLEANKFKLLMRIPLDDLELVKGKDELTRRGGKEVDHLEEDAATLAQLIELASNLHVVHSNLDDALKDLQGHVQRQVNERQGGESQLAALELAISTQEGTETLSVAFASSEKKTLWEDAFNEAKQKLGVLCPNRRPPPEFLYPLPIRKTRAGLQFTCSAATPSLFPHLLRDVWVCNSDGYVGQVCVLSLIPEPNVTSCNGVCNARILCVAAIPAAPQGSIDSAPARRKLLKSEGKSGSNSGASTDEGNENSGNFELESSESSEEEEEEGESGEEDSSVLGRKREDSVCFPTSSTTPLALTDNADGESTSQATMWLGTEDGYIHIYHCGDNIRIKKNRLKLQQGAAVLCITHMDNHVFVSLANGEIVIYSRDSSGAWNVADPTILSVSSVLSPVTRLLPMPGGKLWCSVQNTIRIVNTTTSVVEDQFPVSSDSQRSVLSMVGAGLGVWVAMQGSAVVRLFHATTHECICDVNLAPAVTKMLAGCDDIIRQHKAACLRVTSLLVCQDLLWVGTSAGVVLTVPTPHLTCSSSRLSTPPPVTGISHGHTGHVRFLTCVETTPEVRTNRNHHHHHHPGHRYTLKNKDALSLSQSSSNPRYLVISGGDGYEDFRHVAFSEAVGREDSTNHLLLWQV